MPLFSNGVRYIGRVISICASVSLTLAMVHLPANAAKIEATADLDGAIQIAQALQFKVGDRVEVQLNGTHWVPATVTTVMEGKPYPYEVRVDGEAWTRVVWNEIIRRPAGGQQQVPAQRPAAPPGNAANAGAPPPNAAPAPPPANGKLQWKVGDHVAVAYGPYFKPARIVAIVGGDYPYAVEFDDRNLMGGHTRAADIHPLNAANDGITRTCPRTDSAGAGGGALASAFKTAIRNAYVAQAEDPRHVVVAFQRIGIAPIGTATADTNLLSGERAAIGTMIYDVRTIHTVCMIPAVGGWVADYEGRFECYRDRFNEWACAPASGNRRVRSTPLTRT